MQREIIETGYTRLNRILIIFFFYPVYPVNPVKIISAVLCEKF